MIASGSGSDRQGRQLALFRLSCHRARHLLKDGDDGRHPELRHHRPAMGADILFGESRSGLQRDKQADILLAEGGRHPDGGGILYSLMGQRSLLDFENLSAVVLSRRRPIIAQQLVFGRLQNFCFLFF